MIPTTCRPPLSTHHYEHKFWNPQFGSFGDSRVPRTIFSPTLVSPKRQRGATGQGIPEQIQAIGLVIMCKPVAPR